MEVYYKPSDIVWVRLSSFWWPGEVVDRTNVPETLLESLKKEPVAIVKYFDDDEFYEIVKTQDRIFPYNCERKNDFIKKGMDAFRAKNPKMTSFPKDVSAAEVKTGGNANILSDPMFSTERKRNYAAELFGTPKLKKQKESNRGRQMKSDPIITHRRFLGYDDYQARVLIQTPEETPRNDSSPEPGTCQKFTCPNCHFSTERLGILTRHNSCHMKDVSFSSRQPINKKPQKRKRRKAISDDDLSEEDRKNKTKRKYTKKKNDETAFADDEKSEIDTPIPDKNKAKRKPKKTHAKVEEKKDICTDIIADWDDESSHEDSNDENTSTLDSTLTETQETLDVTRNDSTIVDSSFALSFTDDDLHSTIISDEITEETDKEKSTEDNTVSDKSLNKSCFDFVEDEEETRIPDVASGRKIPRVIPISERKNYFDIIPGDDEEEQKKQKILEESEELAKLNEPSNEEDKETEILEKTYQSLMESTENIELPDVPNILKNEQNFHSAKTVKYPDKPLECSSNLIVESEFIVDDDNKKQNSEEITEKVDDIINSERNIVEIVEDVTIEVEEKPLEPTQIDKEEMSVEEVKKQTSTKGKRKRKSQYTKKPRRSTRSKPEITEADIDAELAKLNTESEDFEEDEEPAKIQVPLSVPSSSQDKKEEIDIEVVNEPRAIEVDFKDHIKDKEENASKDMEESQVNEESKISTDLELPEKDPVHTEAVVDSASNETQIIQEDKVDIHEEPIVQGEEIVVEQQLEICEETVVTSFETVHKSSETIEQIQTSVEDATEPKSNLIEEKTDEEEIQPERKRRKTTRGYTRSSKSSEPAPQGSRRGRSKDVELLKTEESDKSTENKNDKEQQRSLPKRKSTRWDRKLSSEVKESTNDPVEEPSPSYEELNNVIPENVEVGKEELNSATETEQKSENDVTPLSKEEEKADSVPTELPNDISTIEQETVPEIIEEKEISPSIEEQVVLEKTIEQSTTEKDQESSEKTESTIEESTVDSKIERKSSHRSPRRDRRSRRSDKDSKKDEMNKTEENSSEKDSQKIIVTEESSCLKDESKHPLRDTSPLKESKRSLRGNSSSHGEGEHSVQKESRRSLRGDHSSRRKEDQILPEDNFLEREESSTNKDSKRTLRGDTSSSKEDSTSHKKESLQKERKRSLRGDSSSIKDDILLTENSSQKEDSSSHKESKRSLRGSASSCKEDNSSQKEETSLHKEKLRTLRSREDNCSQREDNSTKQEGSLLNESRRSLRGDSLSRKEDMSFLKDAKSSQKESRRSLRGDVSSRKEDDCPKKEDTSSHKESTRSLRSREDDHSLKEDNSSKQDNCSKEEESSSQQEDKSSIEKDSSSKTGDISSNKISTRSLRSRDDDCSLREDNSSHSESKRSLRGDCSSRKDNSLQKEESSSHKESKRSLRSREDGHTLKEDNLSKQEASSPNKESKLSLGGEVSSHKEDDNSEKGDSSSHKEDDNSQKGDSSSHKESTRSLRSREDSHSLKEDKLSKQEEKSSHNESKPSLKGDVSSHKEDDSSQKEDSSSQKESTRSLRSREDDRSLREDNLTKQKERKEDHSHKEDNLSLKKDSTTNKESKRSLRGDSSSRRRDDSSIKEDNSSQKEERYSHRESKRSLRGERFHREDDNMSRKEDNSTNKESKRSLRGDRSSNREDDCSVKEDNFSQKEDSSSKKESKRYSRGDSSSRREHNSSQKEERSHKESKHSSTVDNTSHKNDDRSLREDSSFLKEDGSSHRSSRSGRRSSKQEKEKQDFSEGCKTVQPDVSPIKHPKDSSSSRKSSSSKDSHSRKLEIPSSNDQEEETPQKSSRKDQKSSRNEDSKKHKSSNEPDLDDKKDQTSSSRGSRRHGRSSRNYPESSKSEEKESKASSILDEEGVASPMKEKLQSSPKKSGKSSVQIDPIKALFSSTETVAKTKEQKREELKNIFSFDYDEEELKKRKTYSHKRKPKPVVQEVVAEPAVELKTDIKEVSSETTVPQLNSTENYECKIDESVIQTCSVNTETGVENEKHSVSLELEVTEENTQEMSEGIEGPKEDKLEKEEIPIVPTENESIKDVVINPEVKDSADQDKLEATVEIEVLSENQDNIKVEDKTTEINNESKINEEVNDTKTKELRSETVDNKESTVKSPRKKKPRKPSRWDQKEKTEVEEQKIDLFNTETSKAEIQSETVEVQPLKEETIESQMQLLETEPAKVETEPAKETLENLESTLGMDETSQKEMNEIFSKKESSDLIDKNAEQIELIFGSSPLPGLSENNIYAEKKEKLESLEEKQELTDTTEEKKKDDIVINENISLNSSFEQANDLLESVESQVARITHYEEPVPKDDKPSEQHKISIFDTPEKKEKSVHHDLDSVHNKIEVETSSSSSNVSAKTEEFFDFKQESTSSPAPKTKKTYLLSEQSKRETVENIPEKSISLQDIPVPPKPTEKANEVATKLTNPKKRFVKSFEDSELNKKKEKSLEADKSGMIEVKTETSSLIGGKSPIAFKLKKQFLSKISNIFDEADEKKEVKILPKLKPIKHDSFVMKKERVLSVKGDSDASSSWEEPLPSPTKTENKSVTTAEVDNKIDTVSTEIESENSIVSSSGGLENLCQDALKPDSQEIEHSSTTDYVPGITPETNTTSDLVDSSAESNREAPKELNTTVQAVPEVEENDHINVSTTEIITKNFPLDEIAKEETEYVSIDGNLTVVSEKELAEGQVEITASMPSKKPMTLLNFSMDFSDDSTDATFEAMKNAKIQGITESLDNKNVEEAAENKEQKVSHEIKDEHSIEVENTEQVFTEEIVELKQEDVVETKNEEIENSQEPKLNELEIEHTTISPNTSQSTKEIEKIETEDEKFHDISLEDIFESSVPYKKESDNPLETEKEDGDLFSVLSEHVQLTNKAASDSVATKTKAKDSEKSGSSKKNDRKSSHSNSKDVPIVNEPLVIYNTAKSSTVTDMCDLEDHIPSQIVCTKNALINEDVMKVAGINNELTKEASVQNTEPPMSKLLSRLTTDKKEDLMSKIKEKEAESKTKELEQKISKVDPSSSKNLLKTAIKSKALANTTITYPPKPVNKAIILSEKIIRPARESVGMSTKRTYEDVEDIEPYVIAKTPKLEIKKDETSVAGTQKMLPSTLLSVNAPKQYVYSTTNKQLLNAKKPSGKAKILNQTIIRPAGDSSQAKALPEDNVDFDINSMPIVLSDELLTPETLENIPIVLGEQAQKVNPVENMKIVIEKKALKNAKQATKTVALSPTVNSATIKLPIVKKNTPKVLQTPKLTQKIFRQVTPGAKSPKFVVLPDTPTKPGQVIKKQTNILRKSIPATCAASSSTTSNSSESTGHKIMIFTNPQGKQQRLLLTPAQQKLFGMQVAGKTLVKTATAVQKSQLAKVQNSGASTSKLTGQTLQTAKVVKTIGSNVATTPQMKIVPPLKTQKVFMSGVHANKPPQQKTFLIQNQHGQTVRKIQGTNEALLEKQVAEQLEAIKVSAMKGQQRQHEARLNVVSKSMQSSTRKPVTKPRQTIVSQGKPSHLSSTTSSAGPSRSIEQHVPPLTPLKQDKKLEEVLKQTPSQSKPAQSKPDRPLHQLVIQDNAGNQTTITEGQILALPSETVDGQPQSYMLVTLDETGNLTPLNNEALMSLDPSLAGLTGGDLSNMVLQMDAGASKGNLGQTAQLQAAPSTTVVQEKPKQEVPKPVAPPKPVEQVVAPLEQQTAQVQVTCNINGDSGQQIILTGDPAATQKFLDSLSDGSTDLANILAGAEGNSFLIQADGQQILINTEPTEAPLLRHSTSIAERPEQRSPMFSTHSGKNQDILAAALADTDVFQQDQVSTQGKIHSQLSPGQTLFPMNVSNVLETSLTLNSPIMTPLEVPSSNSKRIPDEEADILTTHVPKNVDLPITITDPNISQTVSHQQVLMASDLQSNLELTLPMSETSMSVTSGMNSPSFVYSLPSLDVAEHTEIGQKSYSSMPLLTEDIEESPSFAPLPPKMHRSTPSSVENTKTEEDKQSIVESMSSRRMIPTGGSFMEEGLCTLGAEMCSSLSEPPPEMFDIPMESEGLNFLNKTQNESKEKSDPVNSGLLMDDNSLEMPVQSQIAVEFKDSSQSSNSSSSQDKTL